MSFITELASIVGERNLVRPGDDQAPFLTDWRARYRGEALAVVKPAGTAEVAAVVRACAARGVAIVPQGGNTGMCGAAVPNVARDTIVVRLDRMNRVRWTSRLGDAIAVDAGCILAEVQRAAEAVDALFPLSLGAEGSCQVGGNLSTNAGGTAVLRYGTMRELTLGLEAVLPNGEVLDAMTSLRKDSTGVDLKQLFIGAEGTLGIITGAVLKLFPRPRRRATALVALGDIDTVLQLLVLARARFGDRLSSFEAMSRGQVEVIAQHVPDVAIPFPLDPAWFVLVEITDTQAEAELAELLEASLGAALEQGLAQDVIVASSEAQANALWRIRHSVSEGSKRAGHIVSHDSSVPLEAQAEFVQQVEAAIAATDREARVVMHGHVGDGNMHVLAIIDPERRESAEALAERAARISCAVDAVTAALGGSISAEHGIGQSNRARFGRVAKPVELALMRSLKAMLDPHSLMNPGKVLPEA